jgi:hypothetical protein
LLRIWLVLFDWLGRINGMLDGEGQRLPDARKKRVRRKNWAGGAD